MKRQDNRRSKMKNEKRKEKRDFRPRDSRANKYEDSSAFDEGLQLEGRNPVLEALNHNKPIDKIIVKKGGIEGTLKVIVAKAREKGIIVQEADKEKMALISKSNNNQGVIALCPAHEYCELSDIIASARNKGEDPFIIVCDEITDPHNLGSIIRTAYGAGAHGVVIPKRRAVGLTAIVSKTSAGALEFVPVARVTNMARAIDALKAENIWVACADMSGKEFFNSDLKGAIAIVIGNEGSGVSELVKKKCDFTVGIPMYGTIDSLNAGVSAGLIMYEVVRQRKFSN
ncbi:MAG: 23S rRNA (guanosine(2251)-2'-O)-methyltransferase RlmB [Clostridia bacterium]|nr:23S rRNA (guanosine(2251)-2'-O)-methyltransferase RlmB [Clostridia bacterium]